MKSTDLALTAVLAVSMMLVAAVPQFWMHFVAIAGVALVVLLVRFGHAGITKAKERLDPYSLKELQRLEEVEELERIKSWHDETR